MRAVLTNIKINIIWTGSNIKRTSNIRGGGTHIPIHIHPYTHTHTPFLVLDGCIDGGMVVGCMDGGAVGACMDSGMVSGAVGGCIDGG